MRTANEKGKRGTVTVVAMIAMLTLFCFAAFAIDVGYMMVRRNELQDIADASALAATSKLGSLYSGLTVTAQLTYVPDSGLLVAAAQDVASQSVSHSTYSITISGGDLQLGTWNPGSHSFTPVSAKPTAVRVTVHKDSVENDPFTTLLTGMVGTQFNITTVATASLTNLNEAPPCTLSIPVGISINWFSDPAKYCNNPIMMYPANDPAGCAAWHVYDGKTASDDILQQILGTLTYEANQAKAGIPPDPKTCAQKDPVTVGDTYNFQGGTAASALFNSSNNNAKNGKGNMTDLFDAMKGLGDGVLDLDKNPDTWTTTVVVYDDGTACKNPQGDLKIVGFATVVITSITSSKDGNVIWAQVDCHNTIVPGPGGAPYVSGLPHGTVPNLVQ